MDYEKQFPFTKTVIKEIEETMYQQDVKGYKKYNQALDPMDVKHDWLQMAEEELADLTKYFKAEQHKRNAILGEVFKALDEIQEHAKKNKDPYIHYKVEEIRLNLGNIIPSSHIK